MNEIRTSNIHQTFDKGFCEFVRDGSLIAHITGSSQNKSPVSKYRPARTPYYEPTHKLRAYNVLDGNTITLDTYSSDSTRQMPEMKSHYCVSIPLMINRQLRNSILSPDINNVSSIMC